MTAVTTAGLLAGLFGSAFVPAARAAADDATVAYTAIGADNTATSTTYDYWLTTNFPSFSIAITDTAGNDSGAYAVAVSGATIRSCALVETADADNDASATPIVVTGTQCSSSITLGVDDAADVYTFTLVLNKIGVSDEVTITVSDDDTDNVTVTGKQKLKAVSATTDGAAVLNSTKTAATVKWDYDGDGTEGETTDDKADTTISDVEYVATAQNLGSVAIFGGELRNGYDTAMNTDTTIVVSVTGGNYVNCEQAVGGGVADGTVNVVALAITDNSPADFECEVISPDGAEGAGGAYTITIATVTGTVLKTISAGFLGEIASVTLEAAYETVASDLLADITDFWTVGAKDAAGRSYAGADLKDTDNLETNAATAMYAYDAADATKADIADTDVTDADTDGIFELDKEICDDGDGPTVAGGYETRKVQVLLEDGAGATVESNVVTIKCGVDVGTALVVDRVEFAASQVAPGGSVKAKVYLEDANGFAASPGDASTGDVSLVLTNGVNADITADNDVEAAATTIVAGGYFEVTIVAPISVGTTISLYNATSGSLARAYVTSDAYEAALTVGPKKLTATADFGPAAARKKIAFVLESASGTTKTFYRRANSSGVATYTLNLRGTWTVYATFGDEISDTGTMRK